MDDEKGRLWVLIGRDGREERKNDGKEENKEEKARKSDLESRSSRASHQTYLGEESSPVSNSQISPQPPFAPASIQYPRLTHDTKNPPIYQQQSFIQQIIQFPSSHTISLQLCQLPNQSLSELPESVTPLVYSKNSKREEGMRFGKEAAKAIILKLKVADAKETLQKLREDFFDFLMQMREEQQLWQKQICAKYTELEREYSMRVQQSIFTHKQDCQQLKYEMEIIRSREDTFRNPVDSRIVMQKEEDRQLQQENEELRMQIIALKAENEKLVREGVNFKQKIGQIEGKTAEVRQSNDKLYQYVFDLQQKIAFYKEQLPKIATSVRQQTRKQFQAKIQEQNEQYYSQILQYSQKNKQLQQKCRMKSQEFQVLKQASAKVEELVKQLSAKSSKFQQIHQKKQRQLQNLQKDYQLQQQQYKKLKSDVQKAQRSKRQRQQYDKQEQCRDSSSRISRQYSLKSDKKAIEALQIERLLLQKENLQLKATIQYQKQSSHPFVQLKPHVSAPQFAPNFSENYNYIRDREIENKERELLDLQNYLQAQARKIDARQRDIETEYVIKRTQQNRLKEYPTARQPSHDQYGMRKVSIQPGRVAVRPNNFCSPEAQAIIENVKLRQKLKETGCTCNFRVCRCESSRGSRNSQDSNSREYRMQPHRPSNYSPVPTYEMGRKKEEKSSKMRMIEEKVKRLKSELKTSLSSTNN